MAASGGLLPPASGAIDAICDFRLDGTFDGPDGGVYGVGELFCGTGCAGMDEIGVSKEDGGEATGAAAGPLDGVEAGCVEAG
jgi:hypothetical protein